MSEASFGWLGNESVIVWSSSREGPPIKNITKNQVLRSPNARSVACVKSGLDPFKTVMTAASQSRLGSKLLKNLGALPSKRKVQSS